MMTSKIRSVEAESGERGLDSVHSAPGRIKGSIERVPQAIRADLKREM